MTETIMPQRLAAWLEAAWLERYLDRQLSAEEAAWFETYAIDKPDLLEKIDADSDLRDAMAGSETTEVPSGNNVSRLDPDSRGRSGRRSWRGLPFLAMAASLVLGAGMGWLAQGSRTQSLAPAVIANPALVRDYGTTRGTPMPPFVEHGATSSEYLLVEIAVPNDARDIRLSVGPSRLYPLERTREGFVRFLAQRAIQQPIKLEYTQNGSSTVQPINLSSWEK